MAVIRSGVLVLLAAVAIAVTAGAGVAASTATTTVSCPQVWTGFNVQLIGDRDWGWNLSALGSVGAPKKRSLIVVWSLGGPLRGGLLPHGWASATRSRASQRCRPVTAKLEPASLRGLGPTYRTKDGWAYGRKFSCLDRGRLLITTARSASKTRVVVRMQSSGKTIAVGELSGRSGWIRGSTSCDDREK